MHYEPTSLALYADTVLGEDRLQLIGSMQGSNVVRATNGLAVDEDVRDSRPAGEPGKDLLDDVSVSCGDVNFPGEREEEEWTYDGGQARR
jgi:hypothetical protein